MDERQEFYLHQFTVEQPDLNYRNPLVIQELQVSVTSWVTWSAAGDVTGA